MALHRAESRQQHTLLTLLSNPLVLRHTYPHLTIGDLFALSSTSKSFRDTIYSDSGALRVLDLTTARGLGSDLGPIDAGGESWRAERMDEAVTESEFYCGPLRGIFASLRRRSLLSFVHTLILDGQIAPIDVLYEIVCSGGFEVRILSLRGCSGFKDDELQGLLRYATRPSRPDGSPKLRGVYRFGGPPFIVGSKVSDHLMRPSRPAVGAEWNQRSAAALHDSFWGDGLTFPWYSGPRHVLKQIHRLCEWAPILRLCDGLVHFDAVLCHGPRHYLAVPHGDPEYINPAVASVVLAGCDKCGGMPEGAARLSTAPSTRLPLLYPPPRHTASIKLAQQPGISGDPPLYLRCAECVSKRCCDGCFRFWCEDCYTEEELRDCIAEKSLDTKLADDEVPDETIPPGVKRDCWECGKLCATCMERTSSRCKRCGYPYCVLHYDGSTQTTCDWCQFGRRRGRELY